nr:hypothetical protein CFP56_76440 [Quercus suber]
MGKDSKLSLLTRLKRAVKNVRFLLDFNINQWRLASVLGHASSSSKRISFNDRPGLRAVCDDDTIDFEDSVGSSVGSSRSGIQRTISCPSEDDVDKKADMFIANFYRQLQIERQISLELQYCRGNSFNAGQQSNGGASQQSKETAGNYTDSSASTIASSLADKDSHNNKQLWSKRAAEASDTEHQWDVLETIETIPYHEVFIHSFGDYDTRGL